MHDQPEGLLKTNQVDGPNHIDEGGCQFVFNKIDYWRRIIDVAAEVDMGASSPCLPLARCCGLREISAATSSPLAIHASVKLLKSPHYHICRCPFVLRLSITRSHAEFFVISNRTPSYT